MWAKHTDNFGNDETSLTHDSWIAEHVWIGVLGAFLVYLAVLAMVRRFDTELASLELFVAWPALTWATGSDYAGYAPTRAGWIAGAAWLGVLAVCLAWMFVRSVLDL